MDALVRELSFSRAASCWGPRSTGKPCYGLKFSTRRPGDRLPTHYLVWVDQASFLPLMVKTYRDTANQTMSKAVDLRTNIMVPSETFHYEPAPDTFHVYGEVDPFVFALGLPRLRPFTFDLDPVGAGRSEMLKRAAALPFTPLAPGHIPADYVLLRARARRGRWLDAYWINNGTGAVIKLVEAPANGAAFGEG